MLNRKMIIMEMQMKRQTIQSVGGFHGEQIMNCLPRIHIITLRCLDDEVVMRRDLIIVTQRRTSNNTLDN